ncbi:sensor histidine kinase [uncultured Erythrobacter sp.]|uniref:sensor histidine kinase n=1 Tax=uncultured Erythrobacter sp. TaxID=263913 RepID=UPI002610698D|nr:sensor histidine kinase [uncultured Erythrobacter sp.]
MVRSAELANADHRQSWLGDWLARYPRALPALLFLAIGAITTSSVYTIEQYAPGKSEIRVYQGEPESGELLVSAPLDAAGIDDAVPAKRFDAAGSDLTLVVEMQESRLLSAGSMFTLMFGLALACLLSLVVRMLAKQANQNRMQLEFFAEQYSIRDSMSHELSHRVKNTLTNVLSILALTRRRAENLDDFADSLEGRIRSLSATHELLASSDWGTTPINAIVEAEIGYFAEDGVHDVEIAGPHVELAPKDALSFGLAMHELATNAAKFGALGEKGGQVGVRWQLKEGNIAEVEWRESGGPEVAGSQPRGFGTELIEKIVTHELKNRVELEFLPEGVRCTINVPIRLRTEFKMRE